MRISKKIGAAIAVTAALALSACGGSDSSSGPRTKNAALSQPEKMLGSDEVVVEISGLSGNIRGIATNGSKLFVRTSDNPNGVIYETDFDGQNTVKHDVSNAPGDVDGAQANLAMSHGCIWTSSHSGNLYCTSTSDWTAAQVSVPDEKPLPAGQFWMHSDMTDFPDGRIARISYPSGTDSGGESTLRVYNVTGSGTSATITWDKDYTLTDTARWPGDDHGIATDGRYLYRIQYAQGYKVWDLEAGDTTPVLFDGNGSGDCGDTGTFCRINPAGFSNATYIAHDHVNARYLVGDFDAQRYYYTKSGTPGSIPSTSVETTETTVAPETTTTVEVKVTSHSIDEADTMLVEGDETYNPANNKTFNAPAGKKFGEVLWASYGTPTVEGKVLTFSGCNSDSSVSVVQDAAQGKTSFVLPAGNSNYGDPCYGTYKRVKALITLVDDENYVANAMATGVAIDAPGTAYFETAEHYAKEVTAPEGKMFGKVLFASYGIQNLSGNKVSLGWCNSTQSVDKVKAALSNKKTGTIPAENGNYGDPCYGTYKYVKVVMELIDDPDYVKPTSPTTTVAPASIAAPTNVAVNASNGSATVTWDAPAAGNTEVTGYMVQVSADGFRNATTISVDSLEALAFGLANGQEHEFRVAATNRESGVVSEWSTVVKATPTAPTSTTSTSVAPEGVVSDASIKTSDKTITITTDATTINCDKACYDAIAAGLGVTDGPVYVSIDGGERIALDGAQYTTIPVGKSAKKLSFMTVKDDVVQQISLDVKRDGKSTISSSNSTSGSGNSSSSWLWLLILLAVILGGGGYAYSRKKN
jgi:hypothetical protein